MGFGIYGKLPQKRDFVTYGIPRAVLEPFETWLQSAVAASRSELGRDWEELYLVSPIWRFWIGPGIFGQNFLGAIMPSVDRVGRFFPLVIAHCGEGGAVAPPFSPRDEWYAALEQRLLSVLDENVEIEVETLTHGLETPSDDFAPPAPAGEPFKSGTIWTAGTSDTAGALVTAIVQADYWRAAATRSYWWTGGGAAGAAVAYAGEGLPDPYFLARMLRPPVMPVEEPAAEGEAVDVQ